MEENLPPIIIENVTPEINAGCFITKCMAGDKFIVEADIFKDGHDAIEAVLLFKKKTQDQWQEGRMHLLENDRWQGFFTPTENARYLYTIEAVDTYGRKSRYHRTLELMADRKVAEYGAWYEFFPRSQGTFKDCISRLQEIKVMGFNVVYLPPIHPIGVTNRKGEDNVLVAGEDSPGSPWAIGNKEGGHKAVDPRLGGLSEFKMFMEASRHLGVELALDLAYQCSPDHPYVTQHPEWFYHRPDGSIQFAENPPKKYEDIYPLNFYCENHEVLWQELKSVVVYWVEQGIKIFRVDNPHTKPFYFWKWLIDEIQQEHPEVIFLSEAFAPPKIMTFLAKAGFSQSYTYFTWRNSKVDLQAYLEELVHTDMKYYFRGNFFANTPDILPEYLQKGGRPAFQIRAVLASTLSSSYGIYSGFELCENIAKPNSEEYAGSEKYSIKIRDWNQAGNIKDFVKALNTIRQENPALQEYKNLEFYQTFNEHILCYGKSTADRSNMIVIVVNVDPYLTHEDMVILPLWKFGISEGQAFQMQDLLGDRLYTWKGSSNYVRLDPFVQPAHIFRLRP